MNAENAENNTTDPASVPYVTLNTDARIPQLGLGVFQIPPEDTEGVVATALASGYRSIDTAARYNNEAGVGAGIAAFGLPRDDVFVTTKLANEDQGYESAHAAFRHSLAELKLDAVDLYLIHWPAPKRGEFLNCWRALEEIHADGRARAIGVSNFLVHHLEKLLVTATVVPAVNQIQVHPYLQQKELRAFNAAHGIRTEAYSPLAQGAVLRDPVITAIATRLQRSPAQVVLRWHIQLGNIVIPKSVTPERIAANIDLFDFELTDDDMAAIESLDRGERIGFDPNEFNGYPEEFARVSKP